MSLPLYYFLAVSAIYILMTWSLYLPYRMMQLHFLTVANMTISGYFGAYAALNWGWSFGVVFPLGIAIGLFVGFLISLAIGDAPCFAVVIVGFTFIFISKTIIENTDALGGTLGLFGIPHIHPDPMMSKILLLIISYGFILFIGYLIYRFEHSQLGRSASAVFSDRELASSLGIHIGGLGMFLQTWASGIGGAAGVLYAYLMRNLFPDFFTFHFIGTCVTMLFVGGYTTMWGPLFAAPVLWGLPLLFPEKIAEYRIVLYGVLLITVLALKPEGIITRSMRRTDRGGNYKKRRL